MGKMALDEGVEGARPMEPRTACRRKLVHWVNSLPLASCLLVGELAALRFGDVLWAIVRWLETGNDGAFDGLETPNARECVVKAVCYAAQRCCAKDRDVMHVVHGARCVARVLEGDEEAIAAVLLVLKRLAKEKEARGRADEAAEDEARRREAVAEIVRRSTRREVVCRRRETGRKSSRAENGSLQSEEGHNQVSMRLLSIARDRGGAESGEKRTKPSDGGRGGEKRDTRSQPLAPAKTQDHTSPHSADGAFVKRRSEVLGRIRSLGVKIPVVASQSKPVCQDGHPTSVRSLLKDGVVLCVLAAAIVRRRGSMSVRHKLHTVRSSPGSVHERGVVFPRGATIEPRTNAEMRHNLTVAWGLLKECRLLDLSATAEIVNADALLRVLQHDSTCDESVLLRFLEGVVSQFDRTAVRAAEPVPTTALKARESGTTTPSGKRPYITSEQIDVVKKWMKTSGVDPNGVSSGILEDSLRNGVSLCQLINAARPRAKANIAFSNPPRTLVEVRSNIHKALAELAGNCEFPDVYSTSHAVEGVMMGNKQYIFGILWVLMQFCKCEEARREQQSVAAALAPSHSAPSAESQPKEPSTAPPPPPPPLEEPRCHQIRPPPRPLSGFELDVLASELVEEESRLTNVPLVWATTSAVPWDEVEMHDDIVPFAVFGDDQSYQASCDLDIIPQKRALPRVPQGMIAQNPVPVNEVVPKPNPLESANSPSGQNETELNEVSTVIHAEPALPECTVLPQKPELPSFARGQVDQVCEWLRSLGIKLHNPQDLHTPNAVLTEFQSGVLLCDIVQRLEHMRSMEGVCRQENLAKAQALHNVEKALVVLQSKKVIPLHAIRNKWKIYAGDRGAILDLLIHTRKAYGRRTARKVKIDTMGRGYE